MTRDEAIELLARWWFFEYRGMDPKVYQFSRERRPNAFEWAELIYDGPITKIMEPK